MKVLNFGSLNLDHVYSVDHVVEPGETINSGSLHFFPGGKGLNQSIALAKAGVHVYHAGAVGEEGGDELLKTCEKSDIDMTLIRKLPGQSGHTIIQVDRNGQNSIILFGGANREISPEQIDDVLSRFEEGDILLLQNEINNLDYIIERAFEKYMSIILNPSPFDENLLRCDLTKVSIFILNEVEGRQITGESDEEKILDQMLQRYPNARIVLTLGKKGSIYKDAGAVFRQSAYPVHAVDTTAAGDTFTGYFIAGLVKKLPVPEILDMASKASALAVTKNGASSSIPTMDDVLKF